MTSQPAGRLAPRLDATSRTARASRELGYQRDVLAGCDQGERGGRRRPAGTS